jgi:hypothetical protein
MAKTVEPFDLLKVLTPEDRAVAKKAVDDANLNAIAKKFYNDYIEYCSKLTPEDIANADYDAIKQKLGVDNPDMFDYVMLRFFGKTNAVVINRYFADSDFSDVKACKRKFVTLPSYPYEFVSKFDWSLFRKNVITALDSDKLNMKTQEALIIRACQNYIKRTKDLPHDDALQALKDLKRAAYKYLMTNDNWKGLLTDIELNIRGLE